MKWLISLGVLVGAIVVGSIVSAQVRRALSKPSRSEQLRSFAQPAGSIVLSVMLAAGLMGALSIAAPDSVKDLPDSVIAFIPRALICVLLLLVGGGIATLVGTALSTSMERATGRPQHQIGRLAKSVTTAIFAVLAITQLGVNTRIIDMIVAGTIFGTALSLSLLTAFGGRAIAAEVAAGRYLKRLLRSGDKVEADEFPGGTIHALHGASITVNHADDDGAVTFVHVPNTTVLNAVVKVTRKNP